MGGHIEGETIHRLLYQLVWHTYYWHISVHKSRNEEQLNDVIFFLVGWGWSSRLLVGWVDSQPHCSDGLEWSVDDMGEGDKMRCELLHIPVFLGALISGFRPCACDLCFCNQKSCITIYSMWLTSLGFLKSSTPRLPFPNFWVRGLCCPCLVSISEMGRTVFIIVVIESSWGVMLSKKESQCEVNVKSCEVNV